MASNQNIRINIDLVGNASKAKTAINQIQSALNGLNTDKLGKGVTNTVDKLQTEISKFEETAYKGTADSNDLKSMTRNIENIIGLTNKLETELSSITGKEFNLIPESDLQFFQKIHGEVQKYNEEISNAERKISSLSEKQAKEINKQKVAKSNIKSQFGGKKLNDNEANRLDSEIKRIENLRKNADNALVRSQQKGDLEGAKFNSQAIEDYSNKLEELYAERNKVFSNKEYFSNSDVKAFQNSTQAIKAYKEEINALAAEGEAKLQKVAFAVSEISGQDLSGVTSIEEINQVINNLESEKIEQIRAKLLEVGSGMEQIGSDANNTKGQLGDYASELDKVSYSAQQMTQLKNQVLSFFSVGNGIQLFKRMIRGAVDTISDLDAAMTETAVVTDFSVSDMWGRLREYTDLANELGATTQGAYETMTLYYQQGLDTKATFELGEETMKMARIAGMDYSEATDMMTAALRGFNMELNQTSAQHINDVYSELAAITASDTYEISEAMTRTASIAASAGLDFDVASAYLAEAIETTREAPENIGTAMKTIVARFASLTKDPASLSQEMQDALGGEVVEANRVEAALKSAGVEARDSSGSFRNLSDVFLELNSKWDSLDLMTQRYVATQAAGTRQQSRFIAMMQNYDRTLELVNAAHNSTGASQKQFEKTLDSMEAKVNKLKNAWNEFIMNIANASVVKAGVNTITGFLTVINKIADTLAKVADFVMPKGLADLTKSFMNIGAIMGAMKLGGSILNGDIFRGAIGKGHKEKTTVASRFNRNFEEGHEFNRIDFGQKDLFKVGSQGGESYAEGMMGALQKKAQWKTFKQILRKNLKLKDNEATQLAESFGNLPSAITQKLSKTDIGKNIFKKFESQFDTSKIDSSIMGMARGYASNGDISSLLKTLGKTAKKTFDTEFNIDAEDILPTNKLSTGLTKVSIGASQAGETFYTMGQALASVGMEKAASACYLFGSALTAVGSMAQSLSMILETLQIDIAVLKAEAGGSLLTAIFGIGKGSGLKEIFGKTGLKGLFKKGGITSLFGNLAKDGKGLMGIIGKIGSKLLALPGPLKIIGLAGTAALAAWKIYEKKFSPEAKLKEANTATQQAQAVLAETQSAYNKLTEGKSNLDSLQEGFSGLVEGTSAWNDKMLESNASIIELCNQFPKLLQYVDTASNGLMSISSEGWEEVMKEQQQALTNASATSTIATGRQAKAQSIVDANEFRKKYSGDGWNKNRVSEWQNIKEQGIQSYLNSLETAMSTVVSTDDKVSDKYTEGISQILSTQYEDMVDSQLSNLGSKTNIKKSWAEKNGWEWKEDDTYTNKATGAEQEFDFKTVKSQLADAKALDQATKSAERLSEELTKADAKTDGLFSKLMSKDASIDAQDLTKLQDTSNIEKMIDEYQSATSDKQFAQALADYLNVDVESVETNVEKYKKELSSVLSSNVDDIANAQKEQSESLATLLLATVDKQDNKEFYKSASQINEKDIANIESLISNLSTEQRNTFNRVATQIQETLGTDAMNTFLDATLNNLKISNSSENLQKINDAISDIDWSNPISAAGELSKYLESDNEVLQNFAEEMLNSGEACITAADQMQYFFSSNEWADLTDEVQDFIKTNGEVTADNVRELADENVNLQQIMENTNTTATTMGLIMTELGRNGEFAVTSITDSLLALLSGFGKLDDTISNTISELEGFDPGIDEGAAADSLKSWTEAINGFWNNGEVGNSQLQNYLKKMFGQDQWQQALNEAGGDLAKAEGKLVKRAQVFAGENMQAAWSDLANNKSAVNALEKAGISVKEGTDGVISITDQGKDKITKTTDELVQKISEAYKVDPTTAAAMLTDFKNYSADFAKEVEAADITKSFDEKAFANSLKTSFVGADGALKQGQTILASDLKNTAQILKDSGVEAGQQVEYWTDALKAMGYSDEQIMSFNIEALVDAKNEDQIDAFFDNLAKETNSDHTVIINPKVDKNGQLDLKDLEKQLNKFSQESGGTKKYKNNFKLDNGSIDAVAIGKQFKSIGLSAEYATQYITKLSNEGEQISIDGEIVDPSDIESKLSTALDPLNDKSQYAGMAEAIAGAIAQALTELDITIDDDKITISGKNPDGKLEEVGGDSTSTKNETPKSNVNKKRNDHQKAATLARKNLNTKESNNTKTSDKSEKEIKKIQKQQKSSGNKNFGKKAESFLKQGKTRDTSQGGGGHTTWKKNVSTTSTKKGKRSNNKSEITNVQKLQKAYDKLSAKEKERSGLNNKVSKNLLAQSSSIKKVSAETAKTSKSNKQIEASAKKKQKPVKTKIKTDTKGITKDINKATKKVEKTKIKANIDTKNISKQTSKAVKQGNKGSKVEVKADTKSIDQAAQKAKKVEGGKVKYTADTSGLPKKVPPLNSKVNYNKGKVFTPKKNFDAKINYNKGKVYKPGDVTKKISYTGGNASVTVKLKGKAKGANLAGAMAFGSAAKGARRGKVGPNGKGGPTLTGELGQELVWEPNTSDSYLVGTEGPEIVNLPQNAVVWPANQTKKILKGNSKNPKINSLAKGKNFGAAATGYGSISSSTSSAKKVKGGSGSSGSSKGSSSSKSKNKAKSWENPYDQWYNLQRKINKEIRIRELLEKEYDRLLKNRNSSIKELTENVKDQMKTLKQTAIDAEDYMNKKNNQAAAYAKGSKTFTYNNAKGKEQTGSFNVAKYATWDKESQRVIINWDNIEAVAKAKDTKQSTYYQELGSAIEDYISQLEEYQDDYEDAEDKYYDAIDNQTKLLEDIRDAAIDAEESVGETLKELKQEVIDKLSDTNEAINNSNERIVDSINKSIDRIRKDRENQKTEEDLTKKEKRLAYLKQDTSGANALEIKQLEEELKDARRDYQDNLVDQSLDKLQSSLDDATDQRERMIELLEKQLEYYETSGEMTDESHAQMANAIRADGTVDTNADIFKKLRQTKEYTSGSDIKKAKMEEDLIQQIKSYGVNLATNNSAKELGLTGNISGIIDGKQVEGTMLSNGGYRVGDQVYTNLAYDSDLDRVIAVGDTSVHNVTTSEAQETGELLETQEIPFITADNQVLTGMLQPDGTIKVGNRTYNNISKSSGQWVTGDAEFPYGKPSEQTAKVWSGGSSGAGANNAVKAAQLALQEMGIYNGAIDGLLSAATISALKSAGIKVASGSNVNGGYTQYYNSKTKKWQNSKPKTKNWKGKKTRWVNTYGTYNYIDGSIFKGFASKFSENNPAVRFKRGGLADFTGPAWLDGTKSKPELVLNAKETENFIQLKNVLSDILKNGTKTTNNSSNDTYNITIDVKEIANDYDVDQMINKVKKEITKSAANRNVNTISRRR